MKGTHPSWAHGLSQTFAVHSRH